VGEPIDLAFSDARPLIFYRGRYTEIQEGAPSPR
jgi:hypothetical protein